MAALPVQSERKHSGLSKEGPSPESSLTWCLAHLSKPSPRAEAQGKGKMDPGGGRDVDKRSRVGQWRALVAIRTQHIKGDKAGITRFRTQGGLQPLLDLLRLPECSRKTLDLALSILANCCTEPETRTEVRELDGINIVVDILKRNMALETVQNRAARALGNLAMDSESSSLIHSAGGVPLLLLCVSLSSAPSSPTAAPSTDHCPKLECAQSAARALLYLSDTPSNRLSLLTQGTLSALAPLIAPEYPQSLRRAALRTLHELTRGCGAECAREVSRSGVLAQLGVMALGGKPFEELALKTLANMCSQGCLRPLVGSLGVIQKFTKEVEKDPLRSSVFLKALCLCCKEAVNRAKVKESGGLEVLIGFLAAHQSHPLSRLAILACVDFVFDESAMEHLQELGLVPLLVARLANVTGGEEQSADKMDVGVAACVSPTELVSASCFDSFDFPPPDGYKKEEAGREHGLCSSSFLSLRSWLVSEGLISSEGDLLESSGSVDGEWGGPQIPPSSSPTSDTNSSLKNATKSSSQPGCSSVSSPSKPPLVSPSKFSSPHKRRQRAHSAACLTKVTLDTPPPVPRPAYHHPYHPEPWTPESPLLLLLSRFSHAPDPSAALVTSGAVSSLLHYLTQHQDPSSRCFRMLCRLTCNPNCLQALVRTGSVALIHHHLCQRDAGSEEADRQTARVKAKVKQLGEWEETDYNWNSTRRAQTSPKLLTSKYECLTLLNNLRVQCESGFGSGVLAHVMLSGSESDRMNCALCLPLISSNKPLLKKLLVDCGGLLLALQPLSCDDDHVDEPPAECAKSNRTDPSGVTPQLHSLYFSVLIGCLSTLMGGVKSYADKRGPRPVDALPACRTDTASPPPLKRPRRADVCPYSASTFDLLLKLDDGTRLPASRGAVAGLAATGGVGSEYFRALLTGGFGESQANADEAIHIKDVSAGMLLPVLHYLHGCRIATPTESSREQREPCRVLDSVVLRGLGCSRGDVDGHSAEDLAFHKTPLGELMTGACRFLVTELQRELEDLCVSLLLTCSVKAARQTVTDQECQESAEENLAHRTSELELTGFEAHATENPSGQMKMPTRSRLLDTCSPSVSKSTRGSDSSAQDSTPAAGAPGGVLPALLPQVYWFSQRYSYPAVGRACLSLLLGRCLSSSLAADCLRRVARELDCTDALKQDLVTLATAALS